VSPTNYLLLSALLFTIGAVGVLVRRNAIVVFMCIELMLNAVNLSLVTFARMHGNQDEMAIAINPTDPKRIIATGPGILLSTDGGASWRQALKLDQGAGPVAWSASNPKLAYVVGFDRSFYRSVDGGASWQPVEGS